MCPEKRYSVTFPGIQEVFSEYGVSDVRYFFNFHPGRLEIRVDGIYQGIREHVTLEIGYYI